MDGRYKNSPVPLEEITGTIGSMILERAIEWPDHAVLAHREGSAFVPVCWRALLKDVVSVVGFLDARGTRKGDRVAVLSPNSYAMLVWELAVTSMGGMSVPIFAGHHTPQIDYILRHSEVSGIFVDGGERLARLEACPAFPGIQTVVTQEPSNHMQFGHCLNGNSSERFLQLAKNVRADDVCFIHYTSGTTGDPKGVMLTHRNIISQRKALEKVWEIPLGSRFLAHLPWHHSFGGLFERFTALHQGATLCLDDGAGRDTQRLIANWNLVKPTHFFSVPKVYRALVTEAKLDPGIRDILFHPELRFLFTAAAPLPRECDEYFNAHDIPVLEGWGLTETSPDVTITRLDQKRIHSYVGHPIPGCEILTTVDNEILVKGPNVMKGYYRDPERTASAIDSYGWFHTGDMGELTDYGLKLHCRRDGLFKLANGEKVPSVAVELALTTDSRLINQAVVFGTGENYVAALLFPEFHELEERASRTGRPQAKGWDLSGNAEIQNLFRQEVETINRQLQPSYLAVRAFVIIPDDLTVANGCLTPSMKIIRHQVEGRYKDWIRAIFCPAQHPEKCDFIVRLD